mgnify:CR=1 FL=1
MKTKLYLLFFFVFPLFMSACRGDDPMPDPPVDGKRTVLVYMAADNSINQGNRTKICFPFFDVL